MNKWKRIVVAAVLCVPGGLLLAAGGMTPQTPGPNGFKVREAHLEAADDTGPTAKIPKSWKLVGVTPANGNRPPQMWFETPDAYYVASFFSDVGVPQFRDTLLKVPRE
jgi:hypothetical protein